MTCYISEYISSRGGVSDLRCLQTQLLVERVDDLAATQRQTRRHRQLERFDALVRNHVQWLQQQQQQRCTEILLCKVCMCASQLGK